MKDESPSIRPYRQTARAEAASATAERILDAFIVRLRADWFDEIRLEDLARDAEVTVQTVIRRFGGKEGLLEAGNRRLSAEIIEGRQIPVGNVPVALDALIAEYEEHGHFVLRLLAQEDRYPAIRVITDNGRAVHRRWVGEVFAPWLARLAEPARRAAHDRLVVALDLYVWKLIRVDMRRSLGELREAVLALSAAALDTDPDNLTLTPNPEKTDA